MKAALLQMDIAWESKGENLAKAGELLRHAGKGGCDVAVLPEMFSTGFSMGAAALAEAEDGNTAAFLSGIAEECSMNVIAGFAAKGGTRGSRNVAHAYGRDGRLLASYTKMHPFCIAGEHEHFEAGAGPVVFELDGVPSSVFICYDLRFPEALRRVAREALLVFVIANWPSSRAGHWNALLRARAIENQCFVAGVNRTGSDGNQLEYSGGSAVYGPLGEDVCSAGQGEELLLCEFDPSYAKTVRKQYPFLKDMRP
ncbi:MAG: carbon-nitrogen family hydrolase [Nitrospirota bacterium]|jgi:omega-amidase